jgi:hypothetical protein
MKDWEGHPDMAPRIQKLIDWLLPVFGQRSAKKVPGGRHNWLDT